MTFLQQLLGQSSSLSEDEERYWTNSGGSITTSGTHINADSALKISTAWACGRLIAETVAMLPLIIYRRLDEDAKERATGHPLYDILHGQPNRRQTSFEFMDMLQMHALFRGNGYAKIKPGPRGPVDRLIPIHPSRVLVEEIDEDTLRYRVTERDGSTKIYLNDEIFHLRGLSLDGIEGVSVITYARESFGLTLAAERFGALLFANYSRPGGFLKHPGNLSEEAQKRLVKQVESMTGGENLHRLGVLEEGMEWQAVSLSPEDSQMLQTREFQAEDVCRWFRVPPHMVGLTSKATSWGTGIEELSRGFVTFVLLPWLVRWQQLIDKDLILASETYFVEFLTDALLRGDLMKRYGAYSVGRQGGWLATNEIRKFENLNPVDGGDDDYLTPLNMRVNNVNPASEATPAQDSNAHYEKLLYESAARVARKESAAMMRANKRDSSGWSTAVEEFFSAHTDFVSQTMCISEETAAEYVRQGRNDLIAFGPGVLEQWESHRTRTLVNLTKESK
ncbi:MAG: phage portal protein [Anaerolineaceae bacterium]|nr:phage portal protein [Anaerolineaceae bacterium]